MAYFDYEKEIEDQISARLAQSNTVFEVNRYYPTASPEMMIDFVLSKVKSKPSVFVRCTGMQSDSMSVQGELLNTTYTVEIVMATNDAGKMKQIKSESRSVNILAQAVMGRLIGWKVNLTEQPSQFVVLNSVRDLFTLDQVDARIATFSVDGVVIDMDNLGLDNVLENLL